MSISNIILGLAIIWLVVSFVSGVIAYFQKDHKFGQYNLQIALLVFIIFLFAPILCPIKYIIDKIEGEIYK